MKTKLLQRSFLFIFTILQLSNAGGSSRRGISLSRDTSRSFDNPLFHLEREPTDNGFHSTAITNPLSDDLSGNNFTDPGIHAQTLHDLDIGATDTVGSRNHQTSANDASNSGTNDDDGDGIRIQSTPSNSSDRQDEAPPSDPWSVSSASHEEVTWALLGDTGIHVTSKRVFRMLRDLNVDGVVHAVS
jgi:hypothetical protein